MIHDRRVLPCIVASVLLWPWPLVRAQWTATVLHNFVGSAKGAGPASELVQDAARNLYGSAAGGGGCGIVYRISPAGHETVLHSFVNEPGGCNPQGPLTLSGGAIYGTTTSGGKIDANNGVLYKLTLSDHQYTMLHRFTDWKKGLHPTGGVVQDSAGNLFGAAATGGAGRHKGNGLIYKVDTAGHYMVLHVFQGGALGAHPNSVLLDSAGNLYGTTNGITREAAGTVYKLGADGTFTVLYAFTGKADPAGPDGLVQDSSGNLYGTTVFGGAGHHGVAYEVRSGGQFRVLYDFGNAAGGQNPHGLLSLDHANRLYGTTKAGGSNGMGVVFRLDTDGHETVLHNFGASGDGARPYAGVLRDASGNLFGATTEGGAANNGSVYRIDAAGNESVLYSFETNDDAPPSSSVVRDASGNLYGTENGGILYRIDPSGNYETLYQWGASNPIFPNGELALDAQGNIYGLSPNGTTNTGDLYKIAPSGTAQVVYTFPTNYSASAEPVTLDADGNIYGPASAPEGTPCDNPIGTGDCGALFKLDAAGNFTVLHTFTGPDGAVPNPGLVLDSTGNLYGTASEGGANDYGVIFKLDPSGNLTVLHSFSCQTDGCYPIASVTLDSAGNLYGTTWDGGPANSGTVYKLDPSGNYTVLHGFTCQADGCKPIAGVVVDFNGNIYGSTGRSGTGDRAADLIYEIDPSGNFTVLHSFSGLLGPGGGPSGLSPDQSGNLYGTVSVNDRNRQGFVYKLAPR